MLPVGFLRQRIGLANSNSFLKGGDIVAKLEGGKWGEPCKAKLGLRPVGGVELTGASRGEGGGRVMTVFLGISLFRVSDITH